MPSPAADDEPQHYGRQRPDGKPHEMRSFKVE
jgi:hypothetical protein